ncbi:MAG: hypothetical protein NTU44_07835 [Bacteroidetes bacterium]|nr:hypothetical protein [Bacteroidota bacterium]
MDTIAHFNIPDRRPGRMIRSLQTCFVTILLGITIPAHSQSTFRGILLTRQDSIPIEFAAVKLIDLNKYAETDVRGMFTFQVPGKLKILHFEIFAIGLRDTIVIQRTSNTEERIYINKRPLPLAPVTVKAMSPIDIVRKAVEMIPINNTDSSFASFSFFRQYHRVNGIFKNLIEAQVVVATKLTVSGNRIKASNSFDIEQMRRSDFNYDIDDFNYYQTELADLTDKNAVYNLRISPINPNALYYYIFHFDTTLKSDDYIIKYICNDFSSEDHGIGNFFQIDLSGESWEEGRLFIDRKTFAIKRIERNAHRNQHFDYPRYNNLVYPKKKYFSKFVDGNLMIEYQQIKGKWFLKTIFHMFTNEYYRAVTGVKAYSITEAYEWYVDSVTHFLGTSYADKFFDQVYLPTCEYTYDKSLWTKVRPPFYYYNEEDVFRDLEKQGNPEEQFSRKKKK